MSDIDPVTGLVSSCQLCGTVPAIDYLVNDDYWQAVVPSHLRAGVICLSCLMDRAGRDAFGHVGLLYLTIDGVTRAFTATTEHRTALASELARREAAEEVYRVDVCYEDELPCDLTDELFEASFLDGVRMYPWKAVAKAAGKQLAALAATEEKP